MTLIEGSRGRVTGVNVTIDNKAMYFRFEKTFNCFNRP